MRPPTNQPRKERQPVQISINLATASLKDAEHAIFVIGAYFGMTDLPNVGDTVVNGPASGAVVLPRGNVAGLVPQDEFGHTYAATNAQPAENPAATFGAVPPILPPGDAAPLDTRDPAQVFAGNAATGPATLPGTPTAGPSAPGAAGPVAGDVGNVAGTVAGPVGSASAGTTAPAPSPSVAGVELDKNGLPWDNRIHASGEGGKKPKNADGSWRKKRGLNDAALIARVEQELRATMAAGTPTAQPPAVAPPPPMPQPPVMTQPPAAPVPPAAVADPTTFEQLMPRITAAVMAATLPQTALLQAVTAYQLPNIPALASRPDLVPTVWAYLRSMYPALQ